MPLTLDQIRQAYADVENEERRKHQNGTCNSGKWVDFSDFERKCQEVDAKIGRIDARARARISDTGEPEPPSLGEWDAGDDPGVIPPRQWLLGNQFCRGFISSIVAALGT